MKWWQTFLVIDIVVLLLAAKIIFGGISQFFKSLYWFFYPDSISIFFRKQREKDFKHSIKFEVFVLIIVLLAAINIGIYKFIGK